MRRLAPLAVLLCALAFAGAAAADGPVFAVVPNADGDDTALTTQIDSFLTAHGSPMAGAGASFVAAGRSTGIDPRYLVALTGAESSFGKYLFRPFNPFGWGTRTFSSWDEAVRTVATGLATAYLPEGRTSVFSIASKYSPVGASNDVNGTNGEEPYNVARYLTELGGNPNDVRIGGGRAPTDFSTLEALAGTDPQATNALQREALGTQAVAIALRYIGVPYVWGGATPDGFDCSGFAMYVYGRLGITLPHYTGDQWKIGYRVPAGQLQPGDLLFFDMGANGDPGHEGIYVGRGLFVQAPHTGDIVRVSSLLDPARAAGYVGAVRPYQQPPAAPAASGA